MFNTSNWLARWKERLLIRRLNRIAQKLQLDHAQRDELEDILRSLQQAKNALWQTQNEMRHELSAILRNSDINATAIRTEITESVDELKQHIDHIANKLATLVSHMDEAQREQLASLLDNVGYCRSPIRPTA